jgi:hypothetical protein
MIRTALAPAILLLAAVPSIDQLSPVVLPVPAFDRADAKVRSPYTLKLVSSKPNKITDETEWFERNDLDLDRFDPENLPAGLLTHYKGAELIQTIFGPDSYVLLFGKDYSGARYVVGMDRKTSAFRYAFDFNNFLTVPGSKTSDLTAEPVTWAREQNGVLYVSNGHPTYAADTKGRNAYLTAIDVKTGKILWRSRPLVSNARDFEIVGDVLVTGYGFTKEPDFLFLLDKKTGEVLVKQPVKSGPEHIVEKDGKLYVRTYNTDYIFEIRQGAGGAK